MAGLSKNSELKGQQILRVIDNVKSLRAQMLRPGGEVQDIRLGNTEVPGDVAGGYLNDKNNAVTKFLKQRAVAVQLLGEMPLDQVEYDDFHARVRSLEDRLMALRNAAIPETVPADDFHSAIEGLFNAIHEKDVKMRDLLNGKPLSEANILEYKGIWLKTATSVVEKMRAAAGDGPAASVLERAASLLRDNEQVRKNFYGGAQLVKDIGSKCVEPFLVNLFDLATRQLVAEGVDVRGARIGTGNLEKKLMTEFCQVLNERPWNVIDKTVTSSVGGRPLELRSTIAPAAHLGRTAQSPRGPIAANYPGNVNGYVPQRHLRPRREPRRVEPVCRGSGRHVDVRLLRRPPRRPLRMGDNRLRSAGRGERQPRQGGRDRGIPGEVLGAGQSAAAASGGTERDGRRQP